MKNHICRFVFVLSVFVNAGLLAQRPAVPPLKAASTASHISAKTTYPAAIGVNGSAKPNENTCIVTFERESTVSAVKVRKGSSMVAVLSALHHNDVLLPFDMRLSVTDGIRAPAQRLYSLRI
jgi:hypothetical protein